MRTVGNGVEAFTCILLAQTSTREPACSQATQSEVFNRKFLQSKSKETENSK